MKTPKQTVGLLMPLIGMAIVAVVLLSLLETDGSPRIKTNPPNSAITAIATSTSHNTGTTTCYKLPREMWYCENGQEVRLRLRYEQRPTEMI